MYAVCARTAHMSGVHGPVDDVIWCVCVCVCMSHAQAKASRRANVALRDRMGSNVHVAVHTTIA